MIRRDSSDLHFLEIIPCVHITPFPLASSLLLSLLFLKIPFLSFPPPLSLSCFYSSYTPNPSLSGTVREGDHQNKEQLPLPSVWMWGSKIMTTQPSLSPLEVYYWWEQGSRRKALICFLPFVPSCPPNTHIVMLSAPISLWSCHHKCGYSKFKLLLCSAGLWFNTADISCRKH